MAKPALKVYGDALFETALENRTVEKICEEVRGLALLWRGQPELIGFLGNPEVDEGGKIQVLDKLFDGKLSPDLLGFLKVLVRKGRQGDTLLILSSFMETAREYQRTGTAHITSAVELDEEQKKSLEQSLVQMTGYIRFRTYYEVKPELIGGLVIRVGDQVLDSSIRTRLEELKRSLSEGHAAPAAKENL